MKKILLALLMLAPMVASAQNKFGHLNAQEIMQAMPEYTKARSDIEALAKQYDDELKALAAEIEKKQNEFEDDLKKRQQKFEAEQAGMTQAVRESEQRKLQQTFESYQQQLGQMQQRYQQSAQDNNQTLQSAQQEKMQPVITKLTDAIKAVGQAGGYVYIMDVSSGIPYISTTLSTDVTAQVKAQLGIK